MHGSIRTRLLLALLVVAVLSASLLSWYFLQELESYGLRKLDERLISEANLVASLVAAAEGSDSDTLADVVSDSPRPEHSRVIVVDADGIVVADSEDGSAIGDDMSGDTAVDAALSGQPASEEHDTDEGRIGLSYAVPIWDGDTVTGASYAYAETFSIWTLLIDYRVRLVLVIGVFAVMTLVLAEVLARWLSRPLRDLERTAEAFAAGDHSVRATPTGSREIRAVVHAFNTMADEIERVVDELREEEKRKSRFVSDVSHELRTPLTAIRGTAETLLQGDVESADAERFLTTIVREADRLARLADDLLTLQRIEGATGELPLRVVEPRTIVQVAVEGLEPLLGQRDVRVTIEGDAPAVLGDFDRLQQVIANLVDNASRVMEGGEITVVLSSRERYSLISVQDQGPGLPDGDLPLVFDRFYRSEPSRDRSTGGAGLGLAIVKAIVEAHAGTITASNRPDGGSEFTLRLPSVRSDAT